jgi:hypothetical protein
VTSGPCYRIASSKIISDVIDGEAVLVNLESGDYFTLDAVGRTVWELMEAGFSVDAIVARMAEFYSGGIDQIREGVESLFTGLSAEGLVTEGSTPEPADRPEGPAHRPLYTPPVLTKFTDMEDLLTLDPVHEVDELGWPHVSKSETA